VATGLLKRVHVLDVPVDAVDQETALKSLEELLRDGERHQVVFLSRRSLFRARRRAELRRCLREASLVLPTSPAVVRAARLLKREPLSLYAPFPFVVRLLAVAERLNRSVYLLGGRKEDLERAERNIRDSFPKLRLVGRFAGHFAKGAERDVILAIRKASPALLLVGGGVPAGDLWVLRHQKELGPGVALWVGDCFDMFSGRRSTGRPTPDGLRGPLAVFPFFTFWILALLHRIARR
jgi:N-acetylglucosaminyldiphosphoundecaprenol N-acetyl-beta-D-mannosaminyltransferase